MQNHRSVTDPHNSVDKTIVFAFLDNSIFIYRYWNGNQKKNVDKSWQIVRPRVNVQHILLIV